jgi:expansin (peptidoglycan-binding protein)
VDEFGDFELAFEWKIGAAGNSGVMYRVTEDSTAPWHSAHEYQILDNAGHADGKKPETTAASAYALYAPVKDMTKPLGEWNQARIVVKGRHVEHWLNGTKVVEFEVGSADWNARYEKSKFAKYPQFGKTAKGRIAIQDHGDPVSYRNIKIRTL